MINTLVALTFILYSINMNIWMMLNKDFQETNKNTFFNMLKHYNIDTYKFMSIYQSIMYKSTFVFMVIGALLLVRG